MIGPTEYLDLDDVLELARMILGDPPPVRDMGLLGSAVARPQTSAFGEDAYAGLWTKGAALLQSVVGNHALVDGNKRLGWLTTAVFFEINGVGISRADNEEVYDLVIRIASSRTEIGEIAEALRSLAEER